MSSSEDAEWGGSFFFLMALYIINQRNSKYSMDLLQEFFENIVSWQEQQ